MTQEQSLSRELETVSWPSLLNYLGQSGLVSWHQTPVDEYRIRSSGTVYMRCVFHEERTPSLALREPDHYKCYGCGQRGNKADFVESLYAGPLGDIKDEHKTPRASRAIAGAILATTIHPQQGRLFLGT
ncbi:MAG TPA: CHC2 zinc finger domain-containing protein [Candidatus Saccharimonadales bacterium]